jgi:hypothetical protein
LAGTQTRSVKKDFYFLNGPASLARAARLSAPRGQLILTVQLAQAFLLAVAIELRGDDHGGALAGGLVNWA